MDSWGFVPRCGSNDQFCLLGRGDFFSYHPGLPAFVKRLAPDPKVQDAFDEYMPQVIDSVTD